MIRVGINYLKYVLNEILATDNVTIIFRLTLLLLLLHGASSWVLEIPIRIICIIMLISNELLKNRNSWLVLTFFVLCANAIDWYWIDNHKYLISYWCLVCYLSITTKETYKVLFINAKLLIGLVFLIAVIQKIIYGQYFNGEFFQYTLITEKRLDLFSKIFGYISHEKLYENRMLEQAISIFPSDETNTILNSTHAIKKISYIWSYLTILFEGLIATAFLIPKSFYLHKIRNNFLIIFISSTYFLLPVAGFAFILTVLGYVQSNTIIARKCYLITLVFIQLITLIPWK